MYAGCFLVLLAALNLGRAQPSLVSFSLSLTPPELLTLTFDTSLPSTSCDVSKLTLQNASSIITGGFYSPQEGTCSFIGGLTVTLNTALSSTDWAAIQANIYLATTSTNTYLSMQAGFLTDGSNMPISSSNALQVTPNLFSANTNPPSVVQTVLDLDTGNLTLKLYEGATYTASAPIVFEDSTDDGGNIALTEFSTPDNVQFFYNLPIGLLHSLKLASPPFVLSLPPALFQDSTGMTSPSQPSLPVDLLPDTTQPAIVAFTFDLNVGLIDLTFNEPIDLQSVNLTGSMYLTSNSQGSDDALAVSATEYTSGTLQTELSFVMNISTLNSVKHNTGVCTSVANCFLGVTSTSFSDTSGNTIPPSLSNIAAQSFTQDVTQPRLISYTIDLNSSSVVLTFDEPIDPLSFNLSGITLDIDTDDFITSGDIPIAFPSVLLGGASSIVDIANEGTVIGIQLETSSLIDLKFLVFNGNITCSVEESTAHDTSGNTVVPILSSASFQPSQIILDQTPPVLLEFIASPPENHQLKFVFSEQVDVATWNISALTLTLLTMEGSYDYTLTEGTVEADGVNSVIFTINNSEYMFSSFMEDYRDAYVSGSLAVTTRSSLVHDLFGNPLLPVIQPLPFNATITGENPELLGVNFNLNSGLLDLSFSDFVVATFSAGRIRFQDKPTAPDHVLVLSSNGSYSQGAEVGSSISLTLEPEDLNALKLNPFLATSSDNTFVMLADNFAYGLGSISLLLDESATRVGTFTPDTTFPEVTMFELDLDSDILFIYFNEPVVVNTFDEARIVLLNSTTIPLSEAARVQLTSTYALVRDNVTSLRALISVEDAVDIKRQPLCYSLQNCFVAFDESLVTDVSDNVFLSSNEPIRVHSVSPDVTPPQLLSFPVFDLDSGLFALIFSEPVNGSSTNYAEVQFYNAPTDFNSSVTLTEGFTSPNHFEIDFHLSRGDLNQLKANLDLCTNREDCWIRLPSFFINDIGMNPFIHSNYQSDVAASFHQPSVFIPDQTSPELESATLDLNQGTLTLSFSEVIVGATFNPNDVILLDAPSSALSLRISSSSIYSLKSFGADVIIQLTTDDLSWLKAQETLTYLSFFTNLIDVSGNTFHNISQNSVFLLSDLIADQTSPRLVSFDHFNLENNSFIMSFDEPVNVSTLDVTRIILLSQPSDGTSSYRFTGATLVRAVDDSLLSVMVVLTSGDRVQIKLRPSLANIRSNSYITLEQNAVADTSGNKNAHIPNTEAVLLSSSGYIPDTSPASLVGFGLDLNSSFLFLIFDDVIDSDTIDSSFLTIQNLATNPTSSLALSPSSTLLNDDGDKIIIVLSEDDLLALKLDLNLAAFASNTYVSITSDFATDIEGREITAIPSTSALQLTSPFIPDSTSPSLGSFSLDMNTGTLYLEFSEPVLPSLVDPSQLSLSGQSSGNGSSITLQQTSPLISTPHASLTVALQLTQSDLNFLKNATDLAIDTGTTFISFSPRLVADVSGNFIEAVATDAGIAAAGFVIDTTAPELRGFDADLSPVAKIYLTFSETIRLTDLIQMTISLMNAPVDPTVTISLTGSDVSNQTGFDQVEISLSQPIITRLLVDTIASSVDSLYLSLEQGVVVDTNGNPVVPTNAFRVGQLYKSCFSNTYNNATLGECLECPRECRGSCTGPITIIGSGGCDSCSVLLLDKEGKQLTCTEPSLSACPSGYFPTSLSSLTSSLPSAITGDTLLCQQCDSLCSSCDGPSASDCQTCRSAFFTNTSTATVSCIQSCDQTTVPDCTTCHSQCAGCTGPTNRDCVACREDSVVAGSGELLCIPSCTGNTYLSQEGGTHTCKPCNSECIGCKGNKNTECLKCRNVNLTANGSCTCLGTCLSGYYSEAGTCFSCHEYCIECVGPSNKNCTSCVDDEVEEDGVTVCVPKCSFGQEYDIGDVKCVLTRILFYLSIAAGGLGGTIILLLVLLVIACICYRSKKNRAKKGVFFVGATFANDGHELRGLRD